MSAISKSKIARDSMEAVTSDSLYRKPTGYGGDEPVEYCSKEFVKRLTIQRQIWRENGIEVGFMGATKASLDGTSKLPIPDVSDIENRTICDKCGRRVNRIEVEIYNWNRWYKFNVHCHGQVEKYEVTEIEYLWMKKNRQARTYCFIIPEKQEARDWMDERMAAPKRKLLT